MFDGEAFVSGSEVKAKRGNTYTTTVVAGWLAAVCEQLDIKIPLGASGKSDTLLRVWDGGTLRIGEDAVTSGYRVSAGSGVRDRLALAGGVRKAACELAGGREVKNVG